MTRYGIMLNPGELILIPVPFTNLSSQKRRPVIVISSGEYNQSSRDVLVVAVTSNLQPMPYSIPLNSEDMAIGILKQVSVIRADKVYTLEQSLIVKRFGTVKSEILGRVIATIQQIISDVP